MLSERPCSVQCWLAAKLALVVLGRLRSNVKANVLKTVFQMNLGFYRLFLSTKRILIKVL